MKYAREDYLIFQENRVFFRFLRLISTFSELDLIYSYQN